MWFLGVDVCQGPDAGAKWHILEDPSINQALKCLDQFGRSSGTSIHCNKGLIRQKRQSLKLGSRNGHKLKSKINCKWSDLKARSNQKFTQIFEIGLSKSSSPRKSMGRNLVDFQSNKSKGPK